MYLICKNLIAHIICFAQINVEISSVHYLNMQKQYKHLTVPYMNICPLGTEMHILTHDLISQCCFKLIM